MHCESTAICSLQFAIPVVVVTGFVIVKICWLVFVLLVFVLGNTVFHGMIFRNGFALFAVFHVMLLLCLSVTW